MKVYIGPYKKWFGPYQLAEAICWWVPSVHDEYGIARKPDWVHSFGEWLAHGSVRPKTQIGERRSLKNERPITWLYRLLLWIESCKRRKVRIRIDRWDSWSADDTLALIILPLLKQLRDHKQGAPFVDDEDVPENLRSTAAAPRANDWDIDEHHFARWDWVLDEIIWAFETKVADNWEDEFYSGELDLQFERQSDDTYRLVHGPDHTSEFDREGYVAHTTRMRHAFMLFGKYYENLWS